MLLFYLIIILILLGVVFWLASLLLAAVLGAPTVYADEGAFQDALKLAELKTGELVVDLGCGNAKALIIAAKDFGARGVGVERSPYAYLISKYNVWRAGQSKNIKIYFGDFKRVEEELKKSNVVYVYLLNSVLASIEVWLFEVVNNDTRVVSLAFKFATHEAKKSMATTNLGRETKVRVYGK